MKESPPSLSNAINLTGWDKPPKPHRPLPGQHSLFEGSPERAETDLALASALDSDHHELFDTGRDLPGAKETEQNILWDIEK